jgi:Ca2+-binding RTX toxin-like protein
LPDFKGRNWSDFSDYVKGNMFRLAGEAVGAAFILIDSVLTQQEIMKALADHDFRRADTLMGGLIGRSFGGAFAGALLGAAGGAWAGLPGAIVGAILGGIAGSDIGGDLGGRFFGDLHDRGFSIHGLIRDLNDLLRRFLTDPLVLDLDGDGLELTALDGSATFFDVDADGVLERTGWVGPNDGLLVHDDNGNGIADGIGELFGNASVDGFEVLAPFDTNSDGKVDANDARFADLLVWRDVNADGVAASGEMFTLSQLGITSINVSSQQSGTGLNGNTIARTGSFSRSNGSTGTVGSVWFALEEPTSPMEIPANADTGNLRYLPNLGTGGAVPDLRTAMFFDPTLKGMVENLVLQNNNINSFQQFRDGGFLDILYRWIGVSPSGAGGVDAHIRAIEKISGRALDGMTAGQKARVDQTWEALVQQLGTHFLVQAANLPGTAPLVAFGNGFANLDPNSPGYLAGLKALGDTLVAERAAIVPPYAYLKQFSDLVFDSRTGRVGGDFVAFVAKFLKDQPPFAVAVFGGPRPQLGGGYGSHGVIAMEGARHPWTAWYEDHGKLLFGIGAAMGYGAEFVLNVTGWRWLTGDVAEIEGTESNDILDPGVSTFVRREAVFGFDGGISINQSSQYTEDQALYGYGGNDELRGNVGVDRLVGGLGDDLLKGGAGSDMYIYSAGEGWDRIVEEGGSDDTIFFGANLAVNDLQVYRVAGTDDLVVHFGNPGEGIVLTNQIQMDNAGVENFQFAGRSGLTAGDIATIYLKSLTTASADTVTGTRASESIWGLAGNDTLSAWDGNDRVDGGEGDDFIRGGYGNDDLIGGEGNDTLYGEQGNDTLAGGAGNDILSGGGGDDIFVFARGDGQDTIIDYTDWNGGWKGSDRVQFAAGIAPEEVSVTQSANGRDLILTIVSTGDSLTLRDTMVDGDQRIEEVRFFDGFVWSHADLVAKSVAATTGNDHFYGSYDGEAIATGSGNDWIDARQGNDTLIGGTGDDTLSGGGGNDTYVFGLGHGQDTVNEYIDWNSGWGGDDTIQFQADIQAGDVTVAQANGGRDLVVTYSLTGDRVTLKDTIVSGDHRIEQIAFADGTIWTHAQLMAKSISGNAGNDHFYGSYDGEVISTGSGNDWIDARQGDDTLIGGTGDDTLSGGGGNDTYVFGLGHGQDTVNDYIDWNSGWGGDDTIQFQADIQAGDVTIAQANGGRDLVVTYSLTGDRVTLKDTLISGDHRIEQIAFADGTVWTYADMFARSLVATSGNDAIYGGNGADTISGLAGDDFISGRDGDDILTGGTGDDTLAGQRGDDIYRYAAGDGDDVINDNIEGGNGDHGYDTLELGAGLTVAGVEVTLTGDGRNFRLGFTGGGSVTLVGAAVQSSEAVERIVFADGTIWTQADLQSRVEVNPTTITGTNGNDSLYGTTGAQVIWGKEGDDYLEGKAGSDEYRYASGDGNDTIVEQGSVINVDTLRLTDLNPGDITLSRNGVHLYVNIVATGQRIAINNQYWDGHDDWGIERIAFADGTIWDRNHISREALIVGDGGNNNLYGSSYDDTLIGSGGNDYLEGRGGSDTYRYASGDGFDRIGDSGSASDIDVLQLTNLTPGQVSLRREGDELYVFDISAGTDIRVDRQFQEDGTWGLNQIQFADGTVWDRETIRQKAWYQGWHLNQPGNETLNGSDRDDTLVGHGGNDNLNGRGGSDEYRYASGDGNDWISESPNATDIDTLRLTDLNAADIKLTRNGAHMFVNVIATGQSIGLDNQVWSSNPEWGIERIVFADGTVWDRARMVAEAWFVGDGGNNGINGTAANDTLEGKGGNDSLDGGGGSDTYRYASGDGNDWISDSANASDVDTVQLTDINPENVTLTRSGVHLYINDIATGQSVGINNQFWDGHPEWGIERIAFADGTIWDRARIAVESNAIRGTAGNDTLNGTANADIIYGAAGDDQLDGVAGNDWIEGGAGADTLLGGDGNDTLLGGAGDDLIEGDTERLGPVGANLLVNGSFETSGTVVGGGSWGVANSTLPGWTKTNAQPFEQVGHWGVSPSHGSYWLDLDSAGGAGSNMDISQTISGMTADQVLLLQFDHANGTSAESGAFEVYWNGTLIASISETGTAMRTKTFQVTSVTGDNVLRFKALGAEDSGGAGIDNVRLHATAPDISGHGNDLLAGGAGNDQLFGGGGNDIARFTGISSEYAITDHGDGSYTVQDLVANRDGTDVVREIEALRFTDGDFAPLNLVGGSSSSQFAVTPYSTGLGAGGQFGLRLAFDVPGLTARIEDELPVAMVDTAIQSAASVLIQNMAAFTPAVAAEVTSKQFEESSRRDLWFAQSNHMAPV